MIATHFANYLMTQSERIEKHLDQLVSLQPGPYQPLFEAARYALLGGGKRLRPILTLATVDSIGVDSSLALSPACAIEMIHTYSLIHDDLPCMDNDDYRRGKPTVHRKYTEGEAVLAGDFLLTYAFETLACDPLLKADQKISLISTLAQRSGGKGMIGGQIMDLAYEGRAITLEELSLLHKSKTGALIRTALEFGGIIGEIPDDHLQCLRRFGEWIGLAFQVIDDILDVTASEAKHGRLISSDVANGKSTYVSLLGIEQAQTYASSCYKEAINALTPFPYHTDLLTGLAEFIINRKY